MSAAGAPPTIATFLKASRDAIAGTDETLDAREGSAYDLAHGGAALIWSRQAQRDRDLFRQVYPDTSIGENLERLGSWYYGTPPTPASLGTGEAIFDRTSEFSGEFSEEFGGGAGTIWEGTRIRVLSPGGDGPSSSYAVAEDTPVSVSAGAVTVPIRATVSGVGTAIEVTNAERLILDDSVYDASFRVTHLACADGTDAEERGVYLARARQSRLDARKGYAARLVRACKEAGAANVVALPSTTFGPSEDFGVSRIYVGDAGFTTPPTLITACLLALDAAQVAGCDVEVLGMAPTPVTLSATVRLWRDLGKVNVVGLQTLLTKAIADEFAGRSRFWLFRHDAIGGAMQRASSEVESADITTTPDEPPAEFPTVLPRYTLNLNTIALSFVGPDN